MKTSESTKNIAAAIAKSQVEIKNPGNDGVGNFKNGFTTLATGLDTILKVYGNNGVAFTQMTRIEGDLIVLDTRLSHTSGEWIEGEYPVTRFPVTSQQLGSAMSYARRYAIFSAAGISGVNDPDEDDGHHANAVTTHAPKKAVKQASAMSADESAETQAHMIKAIEACKTHSELLKWAGAAAEDRARLAIEDNAKVMKAYKNAEAKLEKDIFE